MEIDELQGELARLADEIDPFEHDVKSLHRRELYRRIAIALISVTVVVVAAATIAVVRRGDDGKIEVVGGAKSTKEVPPPDISHVDFIVVPATPAAANVLESTSLVVEYAPVKHRSGIYYPLLGGARASLCALEQRDGFAVAAEPGTSETALVRALVGVATVYDVTSYFGIDIEVFLRTDASSPQIAAVRAALAADPDVRSFRFVSHAETYDTFTRGFSNQGGRATTADPTAAPALFRIVLTDGRSVNASIQRYESLDGVDVAIPLLAWRTILFGPSISSGPLPEYCDGP